MNLINSTIFWKEHVVYFKSHLVRRTIESGLLKQGRGDGINWKGKKIREEERESARLPRYW